ncbi:efflux RND transporter periplasmic adaptor subunit [Crassaminicella profunda]|uniref:efflux RND transporter periplasmic adaptor subunit n=1 Tax=Crassaminicella profunda TaxID=1286698 RepID=UPI001CA6FFA4|nr:efflux RND transporter periplasmic adaptor subunit [Crassaminicella profunda]QZY53577.1 efflux RND transporter periplasmic adaptor subunit [Crassaminicella profunda]
MNRKMILAFTLLLLFALTLTGCGKKGKVLAKEEQRITVKTTKVAKKNLTLKTTLSGKIKPIEESSIIPKIPGKVMQVHVEIGDKVQKGDILFELNQTDLMNGVKQAEAAYNTSLASLKLKEEQIANAKKNYERNKALYEQGALSQQAFEQSELQASQAQLDMAKAQLEQSKVVLENATSKLSDCTITAPISGFITSVEISKGEMASGGKPAITIANLDTVLIETNISEHLINKVHTGDSVDVLVKSASNNPLKGKIFALSPAPAKNGLTYPLKITLENKDTLVKAGMFAEINIVSDKKEDIITIPSDSVIVKEGKEVVFSITNDQAKMREISLGLDNGKEVEVLGGLKIGDVIVIKGQNYLDEGNKVKITE